MEGEPQQTFGPQLWGNRGRHRLQRGDAGKAQTGFGGGQEPNIAVVKVPDKRLDTLSAMYKPKKHTPAAGRDLLVHRRHLGRRIFVDQW